MIISQSLWQSALGANPAAIGQTIQLNDESYTVIGVMPAGFQFPNAPDVKAWVTPAHPDGRKEPLRQTARMEPAECHRTVGDGGPDCAGAGEMQTIQSSLAAQYPDDDKLNTGASVVPELQDLVGDVQRPIPYFVCGGLFPSF